MRHNRHAFNICINNMLAATKKTDASHEETATLRRYCNFKMILKSLVVLIPVLAGIVIVRSGHISNILRDTGPPSSSPPCAKPPLDDCSFYVNCLESRYKCGPTGYPLQYGEKFCEKFSSNRSLLDSNGQQWMINTMHCLQTALVFDAIANATTCQALEDEAFGTHASCYIDNGLCSLGLHNWVAILEIVDIRTIFRSWEGFKATIEAGVECAEFLAFMVAKSLF